MINPFWILKHEGIINDTVRKAFIETYGKRGQLAIDAVIEKKVKKYLDYYVVVGNSGEYCIDDDFCTCTASKFGNKCWHTLAVRIAKEIQAYETCNLWYYQKNGIETRDETEEKK